MATKFGSYIKKSEEAIETDSMPALPPNEGSTPPAEPVGMERTYKNPYGKGEFIKNEETARPWTGPKPWRKGS